jgi:hypothetical protein
MRWEGHIACLWETRNAKKIVAGKPEEKIHRGTLGTDGRILKWIIGLYLELFKYASHNVKLRLLDILNI